MMGKIKKIKQSIDEKVTKTFLNISEKDYPQG